MLWIKELKGNNITFFASFTFWHWPEVTKLKNSYTDTVCSQQLTFCLIHNLGPKTKYLGLELNKNILFWTKINILLVGLKMVSLDLKDLTIVVSEPTRSMLEM